MTKSKIWQPIALDDLPAALKYALAIANKEAKRNWTVCQPVVVTTTEASHAELTRLKEQVRVLRSQLEQRRQPKPGVDVKAVVKAAVMGGQPIKVLREQYPEYRKALLEVRAEVAKEGWTTHANIAANEIRRLDRLFDYKEKE